MRNLAVIKGRIKDLIDYATYVRTVLTSGHVPDDRPKSAPSDAVTRSRILIVELQILSPDTNAGDRNVLDFIRTLRAGGHQIFFWPMIAPYKQADLQRLLDLGVDVIMPGQRAPFTRWARRYRAYFDSVILCRPYVAERYLRTARMFRAPLLYYGHDLHCVRLAMQARVLANSAMVKQAAQMEALEKWILSTADLSVYPSEEEVQYIQSKFGIRNVQKVVIYSFDKFEYKIRRPLFDQIIFVGGFRHQPNVDAAKYLADKIFPLVKKIRSSAKLVIVGAHPTDEIRQLESDSVSVRFNIPSEELLQVYSESAMSLIPLRIGAGVKLKVVESLVEGVPVVTTSVGLQGLSGVEAIIGCHDSVDQLAQAAIDILALDDAQWLDLSKKCSSYAEAEFSRENMQVSLDRALETSRRLFNGTPT